MGKSTDDSRKRKSMKKGIIGFVSQSSQLAVKQYMKEQPMMSCVLEKIVASKVLEDCGETVEEKIDV